MERQEKAIITQTLILQNIPKKYTHMKQILIAMAIMLSLKGYSQNEDAIIGEWLKTPKEDLIIQVYKAGDEYDGKITWSKGNDPKKPVGFAILENFKYNANKRMWKGGKIHDPNSGSIYDAEARIKSDGSLEVLGYMGMKFIGSKKYFKKIR